MSDIDLERLGDLWRRQPDPAEMARLQRTAAAVRRRARLAQIVDVATAILVAVVVILLVASNPRAETVVSGAAAILLLLGASVRQRRLRAMELRSLTGGTEDMLDQSIQRVEATLRHNRFSLVAMAPMFAIAILFMSTAEREGTALFNFVGASGLFRLFWIGFWAAAAAGVALFLLLAIRRGRRELQRLQAMRRSYSEEREGMGS